MESNVLKSKSIHTKGHFCQNNKTVSNIFNRMDSDSKEESKNKKLISGDKENCNPNRKANGMPLGDSIQTMFNSKEINRFEGTNRVGETLKDLNLNEKYNKPPDSKSETEQSSSNSKRAIPQFYVEAIEQLNTLQSNAKSLKNSKLRQDPVLTKAVQVDQVLHYLSHLNVTLEDIRKLHVIHISGTKGKGSTSAYCESILRSHGFSTGFFSSPHLIEARERIKLNGQPISYEKFTRYFWTVYNRLMEKRSHPEDMPAYFKFLTVMSYYMFVKEKPDVCIVEVGIGGLYDNTNIVPNTDVVGITSLGYDHTAVLGNTMEQITAQKAGIMKPGCLAVTSAQQRDTCKRILLEKSKETNCVLLEAPSILNYDWKGQDINEDWKNTIQSINISLAIQLAYLWMFKMNKSAELKAVIDKFLAGINHNSHNKLSDTTRTHLSDTDLTASKASLPLGPHFEIDPKTYRGIRDCVWPGRVQVIKKNNIKYFLDGAHTTDSIALCSEWFHRKSKAETAHEGIVKDSTNKESNHLKDPTEPRNPPKLNEDNSIHRILVFNVTGERDPATLLPPLLENNRFDYILVTPNVLTNEASPDNQYGGNRTIDRFGNKNIPDDASDTDKDNLNDGPKTDRPPVSNSIRSSLNTVDSFSKTNMTDDRLTGVEKIVRVAAALSSHSHTKVVSFSNVLDTYNFKRSLDPNKEYHVLVTGSLHLVGAFLNVLTYYD